MLPRIDSGTLFGHLAGFLFGSVVVVGLVFATIVGRVALDVPLQSESFGPALVEASRDPTVIGPVTLLQGLGLSGLALGLASRLPRRPDESLSDLMGVTAASASLLAVAWFGGLVTWIWPSWFAGQLIEWTGFESSVILIGELLAGPLRENWVMLVAVIIGAPISEELLFRGYLWRVFASAGGERAAFVATTVLFALYHGDPVHTVALLPTAVFLGWLRYASASLWPSMLGHFANNLAAVGLVRWWPGESSLDTATSFAGLALFLGVVGLGAWAHQRETRAPRD